MLFEKMSKFVTKFCRNIEFSAVQKHVNLVDLVKSFPADIFLQKSASIQPRTSHLFFIILAASRDLIFTERSSPCRYRPIVMANPLMDYMTFGHQVCWLPRDDFSEKGRSMGNLVCD